MKIYYIQISLFEFLYIYSMNNFIVECCANSVQSAINGQIGGANRIELCTNLEVGGITPKKHEIIKAIQKVKIPIRLLIRPRSGNFVFSDLELSGMVNDIMFCKKLGYEGVVIGALNTDGSINKEQTKAMVNAAGSMHTTFNRAFDCGNDMLHNLEDVISCGCKSILTAGHSTNVNDGLVNIEKLIGLAKGRINIIAGSGVNYRNVKSLYKMGVRNFHLSGNRRNNLLIETDSSVINKVIVSIEESE